MAEQNYDVEVAVVGGGMGGLTVAYGLQRQGIDAHVYEQAPAYGHIGGHLTIDTAAISVLARWGLDEPFLKLACACNGLEVRDLVTGEILAHFPHPDVGALGVADETRSGTRIVHAFLRADFLKMVSDRLAPGTLHTDHRLTGLSTDEDGATATFANGNSVRAKIVLGADGVKSLARTMLDDTQAVPAQWSVLRTLCATEVLPPDMPNDRMRFWNGSKFANPETGEATHFMIVPVRDQKFASIDLQFEKGDQLEDCDPMDIPVERVMRRYPDKMDPAITSMIEARLEPITVHAIFDRPVAEKWVDRRIAILGDAAHSMRPSMGQGACQSMHDAGEICKAIAEHGLTTEALNAYESVRKPYVKMIVEASKKQTVAPKIPAKSA